MTFERMKILTDGCRKEKSSIKLGLKGGGT